MVADHASPARKDGPGARPTTTARRRSSSAATGMASASSASSAVGVLRLQPWGWSRRISTALRVRATASRVNIIASYPYVFDTDGEPLVERVRYGPIKGFAWRSRPPGGRWQSGLHGASVGLYRADFLIDHRLVLVCEGEKATEAAVGLGFAATCGPWGASKWTPDFTETLWRVGRGSLWSCLTPTCRGVSSPSVSPRRVPATARAWRRRRRSRRTVGGVAVGRT